MIRNKYVGMLIMAVTLAFCCLISSCVMARGEGGRMETGRRIEVIPQPRRVDFEGKNFAVQSARLIRVTDTSEDRYSAGLLRDSLRAALGIECKIAPLVGGTSGNHELILTAGDKVPFSPAPPAVEPGQEQEGYGLRVDKIAARIAARSETGLFYGVQTLIQLAQQAGRKKGAIPGVAIRDWPEFGLRGIYIEGSQSRNSVIVSRTNIEQTIRRAARYKMNYLTIEIYNLVPFVSFPWCADANTLSIKDWESINELARRYHVTIIPSLLSFGQMTEVIWNCDQGKPYRESTAPGMLCPSNPGSVKFLQGLYKDLMGIFKTSPYIGIGCSEIYLQWQKRYCPLCQKRIAAGETEFDIFCLHVTKCADAITSVAKELGRDVRPMMWADEFYMYNIRPRYAGLEKMSRRTVMGHWQYFDKYWVLNNRHYDGIDGLASRGFDVMFISACWPVNTYLVDLSPDEPKDGKFPLIVDAGVLNITDQARWAQTYRAKGGAGKVLGGVCATFSQHDIRCWDTTWLGYALQGDYTWGDSSRPWTERRKDFVHDFAATFYEARDEQAAATIARAYRDLDAAKSDIERNHYLIRDIYGEYDSADETLTNNSMEQSCKLIRELTAKPKGPGKTVADVRARAEKIRLVAKGWRQKLAGLSNRVANTQSLGYLVTAAHKIQNHAERTLYMLDQEEVLGAVATADTDSNARLPRQKKIHALQRQLTTLREDTQGLLTEMRKLTWFTNDFATGYYGVMGGMDGCQKRLAEALKKIEATPPPSATGK